MPVPHFNILIGSARPRSPAEKANLTACSPPPAGPDRPGERPFSPSGNERKTEQRGESALCCSVFCEACLGSCVFLKLMNRREKKIRERDLA